MIIDIKNEHSRRDFLKGVGTAAAVYAGVLAIVGCSTNSGGQKPEPHTRMPEKWNAEIDIAVVDYGTAGPAAAIDAADACAEVILLEKMVEGKEERNTRVCYA